MDTEANERHKLRAAVDAALRTDEDLEAFCVDFFPEVQQRFSMGMQRPAKVSLLLSLIDAEQIGGKLRQWRTSSELSSLRAHRRPSRYASAALLVLAIAGGVATYEFWPGNAGKTHAPGHVESSSTSAAAADLGESRAAYKSGGSIAVEHSGDVRSKGNIRITAPAAPGDTVVKSKGLLEASGDVVIGVTAPATAGKSRRTTHAGRQQR